MAQKFKINGGLKLQGSVAISGSKNAALPIIAAAILSSEPCILHNIPDIGDIHTFLNILKSLGINTIFKNNILTIHNNSQISKEIPEEYVCKLRASILLLAPLLHRNKKVKISYPGGCVLGKRPVDAHLLGFEKLGATIIEDQGAIHLKSQKLTGNTIVLSELSVTATENIIMTACIATGISQIKLAAIEPHVQDMCHFLNKMGAKIKGIGTHFLEIEGVEKLHGITYTITSDYLEAGTFAIASAITKGNVMINNIKTNHLDSLWLKLKAIGVNMELTEESAHIKSPQKEYQAIKTLKTGIYPDFPTDLQAPLAVLLSQSVGVSKIFETLFEGRLSYLFELEKLGANIEILNPHQAIIIGPTKLKGNMISSCDIRAGAAMVIAALVAEGETEIANINYIDRGYESFEQKLTSLGANIERQD